VIDFDSDPGEAEALGRGESHIRNLGSDRFDPFYLARKASSIPAASSPESLADLARSREWLRFEPRVTVAEGMRRRAHSTTGVTANSSCGD